MLHLTPDSTVVVVGPPGSGTAQVGQVLAERSGLPLYWTEHFSRDLDLAALYAVIDAVGDAGWIVEGMIGYRMLRRRKRFAAPPPDIVIELTATDEQITKACWSRGRLCDIRRIKAVCSASNNFLKDYYALDSDRPQIYVHSQSSQIIHLIGGGPDRAARNDSSS